MGRRAPADVQETRLMARALIMRRWAEDQIDASYGTYTIRRHSSEP